MTEQHKESKQKNKQRNRKTPPSNLHISPLPAVKHTDG